jgi:hypothetical protein
MIVDDPVDAAETLNTDLAKIHEVVYEVAG